MGSLQHWNINPVVMFCLKNATDLVRMHPALYQVGNKIVCGMEQMQKCCVRE
jgi:hypothetical protein